MKWPEQGKGGETEENSGIDAREDADGNTDQSCREE